VLTPEAEPLSTYDLRLRSLDQKREYLCSECNDWADWSVWLHTPEWMPEGGLTRVLCTAHALTALTGEARNYAC